MAAGECISGLSLSCNQGRNCVPVARELNDDTTAEAVASVGFTVDSVLGSHWLQLCSRILDTEHSGSLEALTSIDPSITRVDIESGVSTTRAMIALDEARYQDRIATQRASSLI